MFTQTNMKYPLIVLVLFLLSHALGYSWFPWKSSFIVNDKECERCHAVLQRTQIIRELFNDQILHSMATSILSKEFNGTRFLLHTGNNPHSAVECGISIYTDCPGNPKLKSLRASYENCLVLQWLRYVYVCFDVIFNFEPIKM